MKEGVETLVDDFLAVLDNRKPSLGEALAALGNVVAAVTQSYSEKQVEEALRIVCKAARDAGTLNRPVP